MLDRPWQCQLLGKRPRALPFPLFKAIYILLASLLLTLLWIYYRNHGHVWRLWFETHYQLLHFKLWSTEACDEHRVWQDIFIMCACVMDPPVCMLAGECEFESSSCVSFSLPLRDLPEATVDPWPGINNWNILELWPLPPPLLPPPGITSDQLAYSLPSLCFQLPSIVSMGFICLLLAYSACCGLQSVE